MAHVLVTLLRRRHLLLFLLLLKRADRSWKVGLRPDLLHLQESLFFLFFKKVPEAFLDPHFYRIFPRTKKNVH